MNRITSRILGMHWGCGGWIWYAENCRKVHQHPLHHLISFSRKMNLCSIFLLVLLYSLICNAIIENVSSTHFFTLLSFSLPVYFQFFSYDFFRSQSLFSYSLCTLERLWDEKFLYLDESLCGQSCFLPWSNESRAMERGGNKHANFYDSILGFFFVKSS